MKKILEVHQKITPLANQYHVFEPSGEELIPIAFVHQKRLALREKFEIYGDESLSRLIATVKARSVMDFGAVYDVFDESGQSLAAIKKDFKQSLLVSTWNIFSSDLKHELALVREKSHAIAIFRRLWEFIPLVSEVLPFPLKFHFTITMGGRPAGEYLKTTTVRDHYALELEENIKGLDKRVWIALGVLLDAMQSR